MGSSNFYSWSGPMGPSASSWTFDFSWPNIFNHDNKIIKKKARRDLEKFKEQLKKGEGISWIHDVSSSTISSDLLSVQPMSMPQGKIFWLDPVGNYKP